MSTNRTKLYIAGKNLSFQIISVTCTFLPELADESAVSAIDSPDAQGAYSSLSIYSRQ